MNCVKITSLALRGIANKCKMITTINLAGYRPLTFCISLLSDTNVYEP